LAWASTASRMVSENEPTAANAPTPSEMDNENHSRRDRLERDSRHAIRQVHRRNNARNMPGVYRRNGQVPPGNGISSRVPPQMERRGTSRENAKTQKVEV